MLLARSQKYRAFKMKQPPVSRDTEYKLISNTVNEICSHIKLYAQTFFTKKQIDYAACVSCYKEVTCQLAEEPQTWYEFLEGIKVRDIAGNRSKMKEYEHLIRICERSRDFELMIPHIREKLVTCVKEHVTKYCRSFAEETGGIDAKPVLEYEESIRNYRQVIEEKVDSVNADILRYSDMKSPLEKFISEGGNIGTLMETICIRIVEASHTVKKWVAEDAAYPDKLLEESLFNNGYRMTLHDEVVVLNRRQKSLEINIENKSKACKRLEKQYHNRRIAKQKLKSSLEIVNRKLEKLKAQIEEKNRSIHKTKSMLSPRLNHASSNKVKCLSPRQQNDLCIQIDKNTGERDRLYEWQVVAQRQQIRLEKDMKSATDRTYESKVEYLTIAQEHEELQSSIEGVEIEAKSIEERIQELDRKTAVLKQVRLLKMSPETLRKLYRRRRESYQQGQLTEACRYVAQEVGAEWKLLYSNMPFCPIREPERVQHDIELIDRLAAKRDQILEEQALTCLDKWRTFNRKHADVAQLIRGLRKMSKFDLADKVEMRFAIEVVCE